MSDEDDQALKLSNDITCHNQRLARLKSRLQTLTREKKRYDVEKLKQDEDFLASEIWHLKNAVGDANEVINYQAQKKRSLNAEMTNFKSKSGLRYASLSIALREKDNLQKELAKTDKTETYRNLAQQSITSIDAAIPLLGQLEEYKAKLRQSEEIQETARKRRELLQESLKQKLQKQEEMSKLTSESKARLPEIEIEIAKLRLERDEILNLMKRKRAKSKPLDSVQSKSIIVDGQILETEQNAYQEKLNGVLKLKEYFRGKMIEHQLNPCLSNDVTPTLELTSPLFQPILSIDENTEISTAIPESMTPTEISPMGQHTAIAMRLPRNFAPLELQSTTTNEIIRSPHFPDRTVEYKKELPADIVNKYAGVSKKSKPQPSSTASSITHSRKNKKNRKNFGMKHSQQILRLYSEVRANHGNSDTFPSMPMYEYELTQMIQSLEIIEESIKSYLQDLSTGNHSCSSFTTRDEFENLSSRDSVLDAVSETSSMVEPIDPSKRESNTDQSLIHTDKCPSISSDEKKTVVSPPLSPPLSHHSCSEVDLSVMINHQQSSSDEPFTIPLNQPQSNSIERQTSDEGYRSVSCEIQRSMGIDQSQVPLIQSQIYNSTEKVDQWLISSASPNTSDLPIDVSIDPSLTSSNEEICDFIAANHLNNNDDFPNTSKNEIQHDHSLTTTCHQSK